MTYTVQCYVYELTKGMARAMSQSLLGKQIDGVWHTGIVVYGQEYFFGSEGIASCDPCGTVLGEPDQKVDLGQTEIPQELFMEFLSQLAQSSYQGSKYHLFDHNCNNFSSEVAKFLTGKDIPDFVLGLPQEVTSTPFGQMLRSMVDNMGVNPSGGHQLFPSGNS